MCWHTLKSGSPCHSMMNTEGDSEPVGIVMGAYEDKLMVKYATQNISNELFVTRYQLYLPDREQLESEINRILGQNLK